MADPVDMSHSLLLPVSADTAAMAAALLQARQTILPKRLSEPGPSAAELQTIVGAAAHAPDHGQLLPWRLVCVPSAQRAVLAEVFAAALLARDGTATPEQLAQARDKAFRSPVLLLLVVDSLCGDPEIDLHERLLSAGCAVQNILLTATALGYGSALTSGKALKYAGLHTLFGLAEGEHAVCFVSLGTVQSRKKPRLRPMLADYFTTLGSP
ncbi:MAG: nitroreductase family protein [Burkholderiaceae bacterium]|jgi:nitroreductase|nr:nitroreductase family protein [Burkholderiaceae bacterium]